MATAVLTVMFTVTSAVIVSTAKSWRAAEAYASVTRGQRDTALAIGQHLEQAKYEPDLTASPPVNGVSISESGEEIRFHLPASADGKTWSSEIRIRLRNEDQNGNLVNDLGEDYDRNGVLDRVVERLENLDDDEKSFSGPGETRVLARGVSGLNFNMEPGSRWVNVAVTAEARDLGRAGAIVSEVSRFRVLVRN